MSIVFISLICINANTVCNIPAYKTNVYKTINMKYTHRSSQFKCKHQNFFEALKKLNTLIIIL